jgi:hypothetical protein
LTPARIKKILDLGLSADGRSPGAGESKYKGYPMQPIKRRNFLHWIAAATGAFFVGPTHRSGAMARVGGLSSTGRGMGKLRTEHFEAEEVTLAEAGSEPLTEMLRDLHRRRNHDCKNHPGETPPHFDYLTGWINDVSRELQSRGELPDDLQA